jgi:hypothetical protein
MDVMEINAITGEVIIREYHELEKDQLEIDSAVAKTKATAEKARVKIVSDARSFALSLGFTEVMLAVMYPQLAEAPSE